MERLKVSFKVTQLEAGRRGLRPPNLILKGGQVKNNPSLPSP